MRISTIGTRVDSIKPSSSPGLLSVGPRRHNVLITGLTGSGKPGSACALGHQACREGYTVLYLRLPRLLQEPRLPRAMDGIRNSWPHWPKPPYSFLMTGTCLSDENRRDVLNS